MAEYNVKINNRLIAAFPSLGVFIPHLKYDGESADPGKKGRATDRIIRKGGSKEPEGGFDGVSLRDGLENPEESKLSLLKTPLWDEVVIRPFGVDSKKYTFPNDPLVEVHFSKNITETQIAGGGSIIEMQGSNTASFRLRGVLWANDGKYPQEQLEGLMEVFQ